VLDFKEETSEFTVFTWLANEDISVLNVETLSPVEEILFCRVFIWAVNEDI
jgi:hypothetical protein